MAEGGLRSPPAGSGEARCFGANYADLAIVLEQTPAASFDAALARFLRESRVGHAEPAGRAPAR